MGNTQSAMFSSVLLCPRRREPKASLPNATGGGRAPVQGTSGCSGVWLPPSR